MTLLEETAGYKGNDRVVGVEFVGVSAIEDHVAYLSDRTLNRPDL